MKAFGEFLESVLDFLFVLDDDVFAEKRGMGLLRIIYRIVMGAACVAVIAIMVVCLIAGVDYLLQGVLSTGLKLIFSALLLTAGGYILFFRKYFRKQKKG